MADNYFNGKKVLITGSTGFIGSWLVKSLLEKKADIVCVSRDYVPKSMFFEEGLSENVTVAHGDLEDFHTIERVVNEYFPEVVIHLGAQTIVGTANNSPLGTFNSNIKGTWNVLEACRLHDKHIKSIVVASSDKAYGEQKKLPYTEDRPLQGSNPYDASKSCTDLLAQCYGKTYSLPIGISRCGNFFGGGDLNFSRIVPGTIKSVFMNNSVEIRSDGKFIRDYIYVKDAVNAYEVLAQKTEQMNFHGEAFNFSNEVQLNVLELVGRILKLMGKDKTIKPVIKNEAVNEIRDQHLSSKKAREVLGWKSKWGIDESLVETIEWYTEWLKKLSY
ncbi:MAG: GDP-mannose 4,6-dehydratase [Candidatus Micrarchaeota archaeon]